MMLDFLMKRLLLIALPAVLASCGYHFAAEGSGLPPQAKTIYVEKFTNPTRFTGLNDQFLRYMKDEIAQHKRLELVDDPAQADLVLGGEFAYVATAPVATNQVSEPIEYSQTVNVSAHLTDQRTKQVIWNAGGLNANEQYGVVSTAVVTTSPEFLQQNLRSQDIANFPDVQLAKTQHDFAQQQGLAALAHNVYVSMSEGF
jgi:outer membrane lipopolysaccharide assembly protein LptE/RlpB